MKLPLIAIAAIGVALCGCTNAGKGAQSDSVGAGAGLDTAATEQLDYLRPAAPRFHSADDVARYIRENRFAAPDGAAFSATAPIEVLDFNTNEANVTIAGTAYFVAVDDLSGGIMRLSDMKLYDCLQ